MRFIFLVIFFGLSNVLIAQNDDFQLANQFYNNGEYIKAAALYEKLFQKNVNNDFFYQQFIKSLFQIKSYSKAEKIIQQQIKNNDKNVLYIADLAQLYLLQKEDKKAENYIQKAIENLKNNWSFFDALNNKFKDMKAFSAMILLSEYALKNDKSGRDYSYYLAQAYQNNGNVPKACEYYVLALENNPQEQFSIYQIFDRELNDESALKQLQMQLYSRIQKNTESMSSYEMLIWLLRKKGDYLGAFTQAKALDKRKKEDGFRIYDLAIGAKQENQFDNAIEAFQYLIDKGNSGQYYFIAQNEILTCLKMKMEVQNTFTEADLNTILNKYEMVFEESGKNSKTLDLLRQYASLIAFYKHDETKAINELEQALKFQNLTSKTIAEIKLDLGDYYMMSGNVWEATLLYGQVDKQFKEGAIGDEARYRNARLSYFKGDFDWAKQQLNVLKSSTSDIISNNAIDLSVFIMDKMGLDTTSKPLELFAKAQLYILQNQSGKAFQLWDTLRNQYPNHQLFDAILFEKGKLAEQEHQWEKAIDLYENLLSNYKESILLDDAQYRIAIIYDEKLNDNEKAKAAFEQLILNFSSSLYVVESRKRFRNLRGDNL